MRYEIWKVRKKFAKRWIRTRGRSHQIITNSYVFYEVANFVRIHTTSLVQFHTIFAKSYVFYELPIRMNLDALPTSNPPLNRPVTGV